MYKIFFKTIHDYTLAIVLLIFIFPFFLLIVFILKISNGNSGVFFIQQRTGKDGKLFNIIKFKTMLDERDSNGMLLPDDLRITSLGKFIRSYSIDEIPQLFNILKGDMSFVGPRPLLEKYLPFYSDEQFKRHLLKPGITGWAQVNGRNNITWTKKFELDVWYIENVSFLLDIKILFLTLIKVIRRNDIIPENPQPFNEKK